MNWCCLNWTQFFSVFLEVKIFFFFLNKQSVSNFLCINNTLSFAHYMTVVLSLYVQKWLVAIAWAVAGIILCMRPANERWSYNVMLSLIGWGHSQNDPCNGWITTMQIFHYCQITNIRYSSKLQNVSRLILQPLHNPLKPGVMSTMKM